jgi:hypothetical protein
MGMRYVLPNALSCSVGVLSYSLEVLLGPMWLNLVARSLCGARRADLGGPESSEMSHSEWL